MHVPHFWSRKWFRYLVSIVILYALIRILHTEQKNNKFYNRFLTLNKLDLWASSLNAPENEELGDSFDVVDVLPNCGVPHTCPENTFPAHIDTDGPRICMMGKYLSNHAKNGGRGLSIALIDGKRFELKKLVTFDLYKESSASMDSWINRSFKENDIMVVFTYDEASRMLKESSRKLFQLHVVPIMVSPPDIKKANGSAKTEFCQKHEYLQNRYFCSGLKKFDDTLPMPLWDQSLSGNVIFSVPIALIATDSFEDLDDLDSFGMTVESVIRQPGIDPDNVYVFFKKSASIVAEIVRIYKFHQMILDEVLWSSNETCYKVVEKVFKILGRRQRYVIIIHSGLILSPDFLSFMAQLVPVLDTDRSVVGISAWNPNGYKLVSNDERLVYRAQQWPSVAYLARSDSCSNFYRRNMDYYCALRSTSMTETEKDDDHILFPDVSRVLWRPYPVVVQNSTSGIERPLITLSRNTNTLAQVVLYDTNVLINSSYYEHLQNLMRKSIVIRFTREEIDSCLQPDGFPSRLIGKFERQIFTIYYDEVDEVQQKTLKILASCFGIHTSESMNLVGIYYGVFRFTLKENKILLVKLGSSFGDSINATNST